MLRDQDQIQISLSPYASLYDIIVPEHHILRRIRENIDFSFVNPMLREQYCEAFGRPAKEPEMMFKLQFLKKLYDLSDVQLISNARTDMAYKYFLGLDPEDDMIAPSLMTKFRKTRLNEDILEEMLRETIRQAMEKGLVKSGTIIVDSTHSLSAVRPKTITQVLRELTKCLRKEIYKNQYALSEYFPDKPSLDGDLREEIAYTETLLNNLAAHITDCDDQKICELHAELASLLDSKEIFDIRSKDDKDARFGHKTATTSFFGYKTHLGMSEDRIITAVEVTPGGAPDGKQLPTLIEKTRAAQVPVSDILGDMAYVSKDNLEVCKNNEITLYARTNSAVSAAATNPLDEGFCINKDAGTMQCPMGILASRIEKRTAQNGNTYLNYVFGKRKCGNCPRKDECRVGKSKLFMYSLTQPNEENYQRQIFENSVEFLEKIKIRYRIEEKNGEMKQSHGLRRADSVGLFAMSLQAYFTAYVVNIKRIVSLTASF